MIIRVRYKGETNEGLIRRFLKSLRDTHFLEELKDRQYYLKSSEKKRLEKKSRLARKAEFEKSFRSRDLKNI